MDGGVTYAPNAMTDCRRDEDVEETDILYLLVKPRQRYNLLSTSQSMCLN